MKWRVCERYGIKELFLEERTDRYVYFISKLEKHCRKPAGSSLNVPTGSHLPKKKIKIKTKTG